MAKAQQLVRTDSANALRRAVGIIALLLVSCAPATDDSTIEQVKLPLTGGALHETFQGIHDAGLLPKRGVTPRIPVAITPHHLTAAVTMAATVQAIAAKPHKSILLLSPDHFGKCKNLLCTAPLSFVTPLGATNPDMHVIDVLKNSSLVTQDARLFTREHGITAVIPFINYFLPATRVTPLVITVGPAWKEKSEDLLQLLQQAMDDDTTLLISSDFSHYLAVKEADEADERTATVLFSKNFPGIAALHNPDQSDCPPCLWLAARTADLRHAYNPSVLLHTNSARLLPEEEIQSTTSHFAIAFYKQDSLSPDDIAFGGDVTVTRTEDDSPLRLSPDVEAFWKGTGPRVVNLEGPLRQQCDRPLHAFIFCNPIDQWRRAKDFATHWSTENNHMLDSGRKGYEETKKLLRGEQEDALSVDGTDVGKMRIYALTNVMNPVPEASQIRIRDQYEHVLRSLREENTESAVQIAYVHAGTEYRALRSGGEQNYLRSFVDAGADAVLAHHAHVPSDMEFYKGAPIFRGLGNFLFDQHDRIETSTAKIVRLRASKEGMQFEAFISR